MGNYTSISFPTGKKEERSTTDECSDTARPQTAAINAKPRPALAGTQLLPRAHSCSVTARCALGSKVGGGPGAFWPTARGDCLAGGGVGGGRERAGSRAHAGDAPGT